MDIPKHKHGMTSLESMHWLEKQAGVDIYVGHDKRVTISLEGHLQVTGVGIHDAVQKAIKIYTQMVKAREEEKV
jgi:predicted nucleotidyltransferase